ncbi:MULTISPECIES: ABC-F family ATP-binding cassette domain-containing protein [Micrococcales]|jgi:macrolide transport system ATP-binding/permease protein|uniref:Macrolide transport system ATP-binding/permease protein n=1 Tax=Neomicrococcus aestuarii TaxID=556325 RepID=A0A7W8TUP1_9MICC|nr:MULTISPECIES: ABC-F family ATP-binding cassette domain-containing protein [Micrococcales]MBB5512440.1 macrolide transport system ATP-binding/permease protein [Neomicrococcus aestuarii]MBC9928651.1 ABC-F family ATP-binding cassette domain-containing protein [Leucobacter sp. cx-169]
MLTHTYVHPARHRAQLTLADVSLMRGATPVLNHVDLTVTAQSRIAIVGENGRGKSTLLYVLAGVLSPDSGSVQRTGTLGLAEQEMTATDSRTVGQAVAEAMAVPRAAVLALDAAASALADDREGAAEEYAAALEFAGAIQAWDAERRVQIALEALDAETDMTRLLADLSVGQRYRVRLACLLGSEDDFLLLDEPTNHLDRSGLEFLTAQLRARSGGVIIVSHDRALLSDIAETIIDLDPAPDNRPRIYGSGYAGYQEGRLSERERWEQDYERQQAEHTRLQESLSAAQNRLISGWRPEKGTNKHGRATRAGGHVQNVHRRREALEAHPVTVPEPPQLFRFPDLPTRTGAALLSVDNVSVAGRLATSVSFTLSHRGRLVVTGPNGAGKSTLLRVVSGELVQDTGTIQRPGSTRIGFLHQESALPLDRRASEVYAAHIGALVSAGVLLQSEVVSLSQLGLLRPRETGKRVGELSMGQQRRLDLALVLSKRPHLLLLDEPTNHLSFTLVDELTIALGATQAAVVLSSHDRQLLRDVASWPQLQLTARAEGDVLA